MKELLEERVPERVKMDHLSCQQRWRRPGALPWLPGAGAGAWAARGLARLATTRAKRQTGLTFAAFSVILAESWLILGNHF